MLASVQHNDKMFECEFLVIRNGAQPLIGRDVLDKMNFNFVLNSINSLEVDKLVAEYSELFKDELGHYNYGKIHFEVKPGTKPIFCKPRRIPLAFVDSVDKELDRLIEQGVLEWVPNSDWGTPIVPVQKRNSKDVRVCVDYKVTINRHLDDLKVPLPNIENIFAQLNGGVYFSRLDLKNAYNQLELDEDSQMLLAWSTHRGVFKCKRMSFGTKTACAQFQSTMDRTLQGCKGTVCFFDDILVTGVTISDHLTNLKAVFERLVDAGFRLNLAKCEFFQEKIKYLGHVIDKHGLHKDNSKVQAIIEAQRPTNVTETKAYVGLINYYARFFPNLAMILAPFYGLLKKDAKFKWTSECESAFEMVKEVVASDRVLAHFNPAVPVKLVCDASEKGVGAALFHVFESGEEKPIAFVSRILSPCQRRYSVIDREAMAIFFGVKKFSHFLLGRKFILQTDHRPLVALFGEKRGIPEMAAGRLQRWSVFLSNFDFDIQYIPDQRECRFLISFSDGSRTDR